MGLASLLILLGCIFAAHKMRVAGKSKWHWIGIPFAVFAVWAQIAAPQTKRYTVPATVETETDIERRRETVVPTSIEHARELAYEDARLSWKDNTAGPPSDNKVAQAIKMVDDDALTDPDLADPKMRLASYKVAITVVHCDNPTPCGFKEQDAQ